MVLDQTKTKLLEAAGEEFAEKGFEGATVRAICDRAGTNLAAVNYHFGDKEQLYVQAVLHAHRCGPGIWQELPSGEGPTENLRTYIGSFLRHVVALHRPTWHQTLMLREMMNPTKASEALVNEAIRPRFELLCGIIRTIRPDLEERRLQVSAFSVVGQCLHYKMSRPISERLIGAEAFAGLDVDFLTDHITQFTLAALGVAPAIDRADSGDVALSRKEPIG